MEPNYLLTWLIGASIALQTFVVWTQARFRYPPWYAILGAVALVLAVASVLLPGRGAFIALPVWLIFVLLPGLLNSAVRRALRAERYARAAPLAGLLARLHPFGHFRELPFQTRALAALDAGRPDRARPELETLEQHARAELRDWARATRLRIDSRWQELCTWLEALPPGHPALTDGTVRVAWLRALGELGRIDALTETFATLTRTTRTDLLQHTAERMIVLTYSGRPAAAVRLFDALPRRDRDRAPDAAARQLLELSARQARGDDVRAELTTLLTHASPDVRPRIEQRLQNPLDPVAPELWSPRTRQLVESLEQEAETIAQAVTTQLQVRKQQAGRTPATWALCTALTLVFALELPGGSTDIENLYALGMLVLPIELANHEYWRYLTAGLLHYGPLHFGLNTAALVLFGRTLERIWGSWRFAATFLLANLLGVVAVGWLSSATIAEPVTLVGASGGVMGILGALTALLARLWWVQRSRVVLNQLLILVMVLALQTVFDSVTPIVSQQAHLGGMVTGIALGFALGLRRQPVRAVVARATAG